MDQQEQLTRQFAGLTRTHPEIAELALIATCPVKGRVPTSYVVSKNGTRAISSASSDAHARWLLQLYSDQSAAAAPRKASDSVYFWQSSCDCNRRAPLYVFHGVSGGFAVLMLDGGYIQAHLLPAYVTSTPQLEATSAGASIAISIRDEKKKDIFTSGARTAHYDVTIPFAPVFPGWELAAGYPGDTVAGLAKRNFRTAVLLDLVVAALLLAGVIFMLRIAAREVALAEAKSSFVSNVSHELKTPLSLIRLFSETLELGRTKSPDKEREYIHIIHNESRRLTQLVNNILDFSKIEAGRRQYQLASCDITALVQEVLNAYEYQISSAGFELKTYFSASVPPIAADKDALSQAVLNLLNNAIKYSEQRRQIEVRVENRGREIAIEVADQGIGIPRSEHEKIFEKFYRVSTGLVHNTKGSGLGLALVKHIVEAHRGRILVESAPGAGSRFTILLPLGESAPVIANEPGAGGYLIAESPNS
jgi:signal transduction histidine kinase